MLNAPHDTEDVDSSNRLGQQQQKEERKRDERSKVETAAESQMPCSACDLRIKRDMRRERHETRDRRRETGDERHETRDEMRDPKKRGEKQERTKKEKQAAEILMHITSFQEVHLI